MLNLRNAISPLRMQQRDRAQLLDFNRRVPLVEGRQFDWNGALAAARTLRTFAVARARLHCRTEGWVADYLGG
jgi:hypothetical protein